MIIGYGIIAIPTGIVSAEMTRKNRHKISRRYRILSEVKTCPSCLTDDVRKEAKFCHVCGAEIA